MIIAKQYLMNWRLEIQNEEKQMIKLAKSGKPLKKIQNHSSIKTVPGILLVQNGGDYGAIMLIQNLTPQSDFSRLNFRVARQ